MNHISKALLLMSVVWLPKYLHLERTWLAVVEVESHGKSDAVGDNGAAIGIAQIHTTMVDDVNRILKRSEFTYADRYDADRSHEMFRVYCLHYFPNGDIEQWARAWNGGPKGPYKQATIKYWDKVRRALQHVQH